ncbi:MAG: Eco57I restriction-modification methylase domain-containing protein, partial [Acidimicrobiales bacterium]
MTGPGGRSQQASTGPGGRSQQGSTVRRAVAEQLGGLTTVRTVGGVVPPDLLARIVAGDDLPGLRADDYRLELGVSPREAANRAWSVLTGAWTAFRDALAARPEGDRATGLVRDKWLAVLLRELGFGRVPTTPAGGIAADGRNFPVSHVWQDVPMHLLGWNVDLDKRTPGVPGAAERAPHAMVQELLNRSGDHLWAILSNGATLRLLRDSTSLVGQAYVEFDLAAMFDGEVFSDFAVLYLLCHESRFQPVDPEAGPEDCWLERWRANAVESGIRALGALRLGVQRAIEALGTGFVRHPANGDLRGRLALDGDLSLADYHRSLLRLVYRLLFCFVAEDRGLLADPGSGAGPRQRYAEWFSTARLRGIATRRRGTRHGDLWQALSLVLDGLGSPGGRPELGLPALGGLFEPTAADVVGECQLSNEALLEALRHLCVVQPPGGGPRRMVDYRNLGAEELGGIYESLLEFVPRLDGANRTFTLESLVGNERKTSGAYYTPTSLIDCLLDSALDPLLDEAERAADPQAALLALTVCDPACGSGHFLVAAARRIAARLARVRADGAEPTLIDSQAAMHDVVGRCIFGVDLNPMAAELAKVSLWLEALQPGRPLSFLDAHIKVGNALLGTTPSLLAAGIPEEAFAALEGDDRKTVAALRKRNRTEREGQGVLFGGGGIAVGNRTLADAARAIEAAGDMSLADVALAQRRQRELERSPELRRARLLADAWCAAFVIVKRAGAPELTHAVLDRWQRADLDRLAADDAYAEVERLAARFRFFHWHLEFPQVFGADGGGAADGPGWTGGFSCVLGNPPWERVKLQEQEFFAARDPDIAGAPNAAARKKLIRDLSEANPALLSEFEAAKRQADGESHLIRSSGRYPLCGRGDVNTYAVFAETDHNLLGDNGRLGVILPTGIATDATTQHFFKNLVVRRNLASLY